MCEELLSVPERQRADRFVFERHRRDYILAHGLLRMALSGRAPGIDPTAWSFLNDPFGRPFVAGPVTAEPLHFSLSHTDGCVAVAVSSSPLVGVDVQVMRERESFLAVAAQAFAVEEIDALRALPPSEQMGRFFEYWVLKEAYVKARGLGLRLALDGFSMRIGSPEEIAISFPDGYGDVAERWRFTLSTPTARHKLALAEGSGRPGGLYLREWGWPFA
jgi:4'-phosphopantetheinyl transferase